jgi:anti-sigma factor RsiW
MSGAPMTRCDDVLGQWLAHHEAELDLDERVRVEAHFAACARCAQDAVFLREVLDRVQALPVPEPPAGSWEAFGATVGRRIAAERPPRRSPWVRLADWLGGIPSLRPIPALAAATALGLLLAIGLVRSERRPRDLPLVEALAVSEDLALGQELEVLKLLDLLEEVEVLEGLPLLRQLNGGRRPPLG